MSREKFIKKWKRNRKEGFKKYVISIALAWTIIMFPFFRVIHWYFNDIDLFSYTKLWWELPMFFMSGICYALVTWIISNYLYCKYTGDFTPEKHHHHHD